MDWIAMVLSFGGIYLNAKRKISCWFIWLLSNIAWLLYTIPHHQHAASLLWIVYMFFNFYGYVQWKKKGIIMQKTVYLGGSIDGKLYYCHLRNNISNVY